MAEVSHGFEHAGDRPIENSDADAEGDSGECALAAGSEGERNTNQGHDEGNKGIGKLPIELDGEADYVKAALA